MTASIALLRNASLWCFSAGYAVSLLCLSVLSVTLRTERGRRLDEALLGLMVRSTAVGQAGLAAFALSFLLP